MHWRICALIANAHSDAAFERVINQPTRGIGNVTLDVIRAHARTQQVSMWDAANSLLKTGEMTARAAAAVTRFTDLISSLIAEVGELGLAEKTEAILERSGLMQHYQADKGEKAEARVENLEELVNAADGFSLEEGDDLDPLSSFLAHAALEAGEAQGRGVGGVRSADEFALSQRSGVPLGIFDGS